MICIASIVNHDNQSVGQKKRISKVIFQILNLPPPAVRSMFMLKLTQIKMFLTPRSGIYLEICVILSLRV